MATATAASDFLERWSQGWRPWALLVLFCLGLYLPGIAAVPVLDRDEARFTQATRQMLETGDFIGIRFQDEARNKKPAGIYWLQAAVVGTLSNPESTSIWPYRLPSLLGALAAVLFSFGFGARLVGRRAALLGAGLLAGCLSLVVEAHIAKTDAVLLATVVAAQGALSAIRLREAPPARFAVIFWIAQAVGILVKGPITPLVSLLTIGALFLADRRAGWLRGLRFAWGVPLLLLLVLPWVVAITVATSGGFFGEAVGHDMLGKVAGAQEAHGAWPGAYLLLLPATFWPGSLLLVPAVVLAWRHRRERETQFLLAWLLPFWIVMELVPTKLPHYVLPAYPALALLAGWALVELPDIRRRWPGLLLAGVWTILGIGLSAAFILLPLRLGEGAAPALGAAALALLVLGTLALRWRTRVTGPVALGLLALVTYGAAFQFLLPSLDRIWLSREAAALVASYKPPREAPLVSVGYSEPSLVFMTGTRTRFLSPAEAALYVTAARGAVALVSDRDAQAFREALASHGFAPREIGSVSGINYSNGRRVTLTLYVGIPA